MQEAEAAQQHYVRVRHEYEELQGTYKSMVRGVQAAAAAAPLHNEDDRAAAVCTCNNGRPGCLKPYAQLAVRWVVCSMHGCCVHACMAAGAALDQGGGAAARRPRQHGARAQGQDGSAGDPAGCARAAKAIVCQGALCMLGRHACMQHRADAARVGGGSLWAGATARHSRCMLLTHAGS